MHSHGWSGKDKGFVCVDHVYSISTSKKNADLALELAQNGATVQQLTD